MFSRVVRLNGGGAFEWGGDLRAARASRVLRTRHTHFTRGERVGGRCRSFDKPCEG